MRAAGWGEAGLLETDVKQELVCLTSPLQQASWRLDLPTTEAGPANCCLILTSVSLLTYFLPGCGESKQKVQKKQKTPLRLAG